MKAPLGSNTRTRFGMRWCAALAALLALGLFGASETRASEATVLAADGEAQLSIVIADGADEKVRTAAQDLAAYLQRISGAAFEVTTGDGAAGLVLGQPTDFPALPIDQRFGDTPFERDHYRIASTGDGLYLLGATPQAVEFAVWDLLHRFGYRMFFPIETWEIVPEHERLEIDIDVTEQPSYYNRSGPRGAMRMGHRPWAQEGWRNWRIRNRTTPTFSLHTGHAYLSLIRRNQEAFDNHPEFFAKIDGERKQHRGAKICIGNEALRELVVQDTLARIEANPDLDSISLDPSDGSGWCDETCEKCAPLGSVSDRVVLLVNQVAEAIEEKFDRTYYIGIYAYNDYSLPPTIDLHPNVIPSLATAFIRGDQTFDDMLEGWSAKANMMGIREYYGVYSWNSSMPGSARAARVDYIARTIPEFHDAGARFMNAESDHAWGPNGLGYYLATRLLWDVTDAERVDQIVDDFLEKSFGSAKEPMGEFYGLITGTPRPRISNHLVGRMYRLLDEARSATSDPDALARINDLVLYTRYVELHRAYSNVKGDGKQAALDELMTFAWRIRKTIMPGSVGVLAYLNRTVRRDNSGLEWGEGYTATRPPERMREREDEPFSESELAALIENGIENNPTLNFEPIDFAKRLAPTAPLNLSDAGALGRKPTSSRTRGRAEYYTWFAQPPAAIELEITTGTIYDNRGPATVTLEQWDDDLQDYEAVDTQEVPPDKQPHRIVLRGQRPGLHRVVVEERMSGTTTVWPGDLPRTMRTSMEHANHVHGRDDWYFYVPKGTRVIGAYVSARGGHIANPDGEQVVSFENETFRDYLSIDVPEGQDGRLWRARRIAGSVQLLTVPPYGAPSPEDLLLPADVVEADAR